MQHIHAGHTPEDAVYMAEIDVHSQIVEDRKPALPKEGHKEEPPPVAKKPRTRKSSRKKNPGDRGGSPTGD